VFAKIGALLGVVLIAAFCTEPARASLKRVIIVDRLDTAAPGLVDVEQGNPTEREAKERQAPDSTGRNFVRGRVALWAILSCSERRDGARLIGVL